MLNVISGLLSGGVAASTNSYESIATYTVGSGGVADVTFSSIPSTYKHLQIRAIARNMHTVVGDTLRVQYNGDTASNYNMHSLYGTGSTAAAYSSGSTNIPPLANVVGGNGLANTFAPFIFDILDYADTNKYKTGRALAGTDQNSASGAEMDLNSILWRSTAAITSIKLYCTTANLAQYSHFALYGIKG